MYVPIKRSEFLMLHCIEKAPNLFAGMDAYHEVIAQHPDWDLTEKKTWPEWEKVHSVDANN